MLFVDARGSTALAEQMSASEFSQLMHRFYVAAIEVLVKTDALIDKLVGDEVIGLFVPGYAGPEHARQAVRAGQELLRVTGYGDPGRPWLLVGVGVHTGVAYLGTVSGAEGTGADITALGDNVNITARLASKAGSGEILISDATCTAAKLDIGRLTAALHPDALRLAQQWTGAQNQRSASLDLGFRAIALVGSDAIPG